MMARTPLGVASTIVLVACSGAKTGRSPTVGRCTIEPGAIARTRALQLTTPQSQNDPWAGSQFDEHEFDRVRKYVEKRGWHPRIAEGRAYAEAASYAVSAGTGQKLRLVPTAYYREYCRHPAEVGALAGPTYQLAKHPDLVMVAVDANAKRTPDDSFRQWRQHQRERALALDRTWQAFGFQRDDFDAIMQWVLQQSDRSQYANRWAAATQGYLSALDEYGTLTPPSVLERDTTPGFGGIGATLLRDPARAVPVIDRLFPAQPAERAGLKTGDLIIAVDGTSTRGMTLANVVSHIKGSVGTKVILRVERAGSPATRQITVPRARVIVPNVTADFMRGYEGIALIAISAFFKTTPRDFDGALYRLQKRGPASRLRGLIVDLRSTRYGRLDSAADIADVFLASGKIYARKSRGDRDWWHRNATPRRSETVPLVVLVNATTSMAAELLAAALKDNGRAVVVGERTFGKSSIQSADAADYLLGFTTGYFRRPSGRQLHGIGVYPDIEIPRTADSAMPVAFRLEDRLIARGRPPTHTAPAQNAQTTALQRCAQRTGKAATQSKPKQIKPRTLDYQRAVAADILTCMTSRANRVGAGK